MSNIINYEVFSGYIGEIVVWTLAIIGGITVVAKLLNRGKRNGD